MRLWGGLLGTLVGCDQATKELAVSHLREQPPVELVRGVLDLTYTENRDVGFSLLRSIEDDGVRRAVIVGIAGTVLLFLAVFLVRKRAELTPVMLGAISLLAAGAAGNLLDRLLRGHVVDLIHVHHWPVFNVADCCIAAGAILLLLARRAPAPRASP